MHRRVLLIAAAAALCLRQVSGARAQDSSPVASSYEAVLRAALDQGLTGIAVQVTRRGDLLYEAAHGLASRERRPRWP
jgi:hypothetical protein